MAAAVRFGRQINVFGTKKFICTRLVPLALKRHFHRQTIHRDALKVLMPALSPTMTEGTIIKWLKKEGDVVNPGDVLCDIQTDKAVVGMENEEEGILAKILVSENTSDVKIGTLIAVLVEEGDDWQSVDIPTHTAPASSDAAPSVVTSPSAIPPAPSPAPAPVPSAATVTSSELHAAGVGPSVRRLAEEYGLNPAEVTGTGPQGRVMKGDMLNYIKSKNLTKKVLSASPVVTVTPSAVAATQGVAFPDLPVDDAEPFLDLPNTSMRKTIAKRLTESKTTIPHSYATRDLNVGPVSVLRKQLAEEGIKVSVNDFIIKAAGIALQRVPRVNSVWQNDGPQLLSGVDISVAVATDSGLITPIVQNAATLGVDEISASVRDLALRARDGKLKLHEFQGGSFSISNLGMYGISEFSAVINPPQTAIMAVGTSRLSVTEDGHPEFRMTVTLSYDSRVLDETEAAQFLAVFSEVMENPSFTITGSRLQARLNSVV